MVPDETLAGPVLARDGSPHWERRAAAVLGLILVALPGLWWVDQKALPASIDGAWMMTLADAGAAGEVSGRDLYATYGWGFQLMGRLARRLHVEDSSYDSVMLLAASLSFLGGLCFVATLYLLRSFDALGIVLACGVAAVLSLGQPAWSRPAALLLVAALLSRILTRRAGSAARHLATIAALSGLAAVLQLWVFDLGAYAVATVAVGAVAHALLLPDIAPRARLREAILRGVAALGGALASSLIICAFLAWGPPGAFDYPQVMAEISTGYGRTMGYPWQVAGLWAIALESMIGFVLIAGTMDLRREATVRAELIALGVASLFCLRGATVRSDVHHVSLAMVPLVALFLALTLRPGLSARRRILGLVVVIMMFCSWPGAGFGRLVRAFQVAATPSVLPERWRELRAFAASREVYVPQVLRASESKSRLVVFPYLNQIGLAAGRRLFTPFVQPYQAVTAGLDERYARAVRQAPEVSEVLYALDGIAVGDLGGVQAITRNPAVFAALWSHFRPAGPEAEGHLLLKRHEEVREFPATPVEFQQKPGAGLGEVLLSAPRECSLLRIGFRVDYPWIKAIGRCSPWRVTVRSGEQIIAEGNVVSLGDRFTTFLSLLPPDQFPRILDGGAPQRSFDRLTLSVVDRSLFAAVPRHVAVEALECVDP